MYFNRARKYNDVCIPFEFLTDLKTIGERLKKGYYIGRKLFIADMARIFTNCRTYNSADTEYFKCANTLEKFFNTKIRESGLGESLK